MDHKTILLAVEQEEQFVDVFTVSWESIPTKLLKTVKELKETPVTVTM